MQASASGVTGSPVSFSATGVPGPASASTSTATVPAGKVGSSTAITIQARDVNNNLLTTGGAAFSVMVSGANSATPAVSDNTNGTYSSSYTPTTSGTDNITVKLSSVSISGRPYSSVVARSPTKKPRR